VAKAHILIPMLTVGFVAVGLGEVVRHAGLLQGLIAIGWGAVCLELGYMAGLITRPLRCCSRSAFRQSFRRRREGKAPRESGSWVRRSRR
jgi:hypothetical protein